MKTFEAEYIVYYNTSGKGNSDKVNGSDAGRLDWGEQNFVPNVNRIKRCNIKIIWENPINQTTNISIG